MPSDLDVTHKLPQIFTNVGVQESGAAAEAAHHSAYSRLSGFGNSMASSGRDSTNYFSSAAMSATAAAGMAASHLNPYAVIIPEYTYHIVTKYVVTDIDEMYFITCRPTPRTWWTRPGTRTAWRPSRVCPAEASTTVGPTRPIVKLLSWLTFVDVCRSPDGWLLRRDAGVCELRRGGHAPLEAGRHR